MSQRFKTGEVCQTKGIYTFDGYTESTNAPPPSSEERVIPLDRGERFPPIRSQNKGAYWTLTRAT